MEYLNGLSEEELKVVYANAVRSIEKAQRVLKIVSAKLDKIEADQIKAEGLKDNGDVANTEN